MEVKKFMGEVSSYKDMKLEDLIKDYSDELDKHRSWLKPFGWQRLTKWENLLKDNAEAAICEAATRKILSDHGVKVDPNEDISTGGPDFLCIKNGKRLYVEATCITKEKAIGKTNMPDKPEGASYYRCLTKVILNEIRNKTTQCSGLNAPCIIAIGTLHFQVGRRCFNRNGAELLLTGSTSISVPFDAQLGQAIGDPHQTTNLHDSAFIRPAKTSTSQIEYARSPISAVLLCPFGSLPTKVIGVLHPNPNHNFDRTLLSGIKFCRLAKGYQTDQFQVEWI